MHSSAPEPVLELSESTIITLKMLNAYGACTEGMRWVKKNLPEGAEYGAFIRALEEANRKDWAEWLIDHFGASIIASKWRIKEILDATDPSKVEPSSPELNSSGYYAQIGSSGDSAKIGSSGYYAKIGSSGYYAQIGSSGDSAKIGSSGYSAKIGSSGYSAKIGSSGYSAKISATGRKSIVGAVGYDSIGKVGEDGCLALAWWDEKAQRPRLAVGYVGEELKADTWYSVQNGKFVEVKEGR